MDHLREYWHYYCAVLITLGSLFYGYRKTDPTKPPAKRLMSMIMIRGYEYRDPESPSYDPNLMGRQLLLVMIGMMVIGLALLLVRLLR